MRTDEACSLCAFIDNTYLADLGEYCTTSQQCRRKPAMFTASGNTSQWAQQQVVAL